MSKRQNATQRIEYLVHKINHKTQAYLTSLVRAGHCTPFWRCILESLGCLVAVGCGWSAQVERGVQLAWGASRGPAGCTRWGTSIQLVSPTGGASEQLLWKIKLHVFVSCKFKSMSLGVRCGKAHGHEFSPQEFLSKMLS